MSTTEERITPRALEPSALSHAQAPAPRTRSGVALPAFVRRILLSEFFILYLTLLFFVVAALFFPTLSLPSNIANQFLNIWPLLAVAIGQTFVLIIGGIDLSQGAVMGITSVIGALLMATVLDEPTFSNSPLWGVFISESGGILSGSAWAVPISVGVMLLIGTFIGFLNGTFITRFNMAPFMVTLVTLIFFSNFALWLTASRNVSGLPEEFVRLGNGDIVSVFIGPKLESQIPRREVLPAITYPAVISVGLSLAASVLLSRTVFGKHMFSIGTNRRASEISGIPSKRVITMVYMFSGFCAAAASILYSARLGIGQPSLGSGNILLDIIGAAVIGGTSLFGGKGSVRGTFFGVAFFILLLNILNAMRLSPFVIDAVKGLIILLAALFDVTRSRLLTREARA